MKVIVKFGGTLLDDERSLNSLCVQLAEIAKAPDIECVAVHGGGKQMTRYLAERGVESRFVEGLRVTGPEVVDAILKVFAGSVNKGFVSALQRAGAKAVGITGIDGLLAEAETMDERLGAVGRIVRSNPAVLEALIKAAFLPVVACVAGGAQGRVYNVNADQMAVACAGAWGAERLYFLTDVDGVRGGDGTILPVLSRNGAQELIESGIATGGMLAKLKSAIQAIEWGIGEVRIAPGSAERVLERLVRGDELGTAVRRGG